MKLLIGLGNPGPRYRNTRHNLGQKIVLDLVKALKLKLQNSDKLQCQFARAGDTLIAVNNSYMNLSGGPVQKIAKYFKVHPSDIYIVHDDLDLPVGEYRYQFDRGPAGHNGIKSVIDNLGTQSFHRVRVGIDHPRNNAPNTLVEDYVLRPFDPHEKVIIDRVIDKILPQLVNIIEA